MTRRDELVNLLYTSGLDEGAAACLEGYVDAALAEAAQQRGGLDVRAEVQHALDALNAASDKMGYGDSPESDFLEAHATLDSLLSRLAPQPSADAKRPVPPADPQSSAARLSELRDQGDEE